MLLFIWSQDLLHIWTTGIFKTLSLLTSASPSHLPVSRPWLVTPVHASHRISSQLAQTWLLQEHGYRQKPCQWHRTQCSALNQCLHSTDEQWSWERSTASRLQSSLQSSPLLPEFRVSGNWKNLIASPLMLEGTKYSKYHLSEELLNQCGHLHLLQTKHFHHFLSHPPISLKPACSVHFYFHQLPVAEFQQLSHKESLQNNFSDHTGYYLLFLFQ